MDPVTHILGGASLAATRLGRTSRLAAPALILGANLPDVDVLSYLVGDDFALGFRRGWTHGVPALLVLPALFTALLYLWARLFPQRAGPPLAPRWLATLSYAAVVTHPALDWLNNYGMRWWMPIRDTWYYGDSVFIVDPWLWLTLGGFWLAGRRPTRRSGVSFGVVAALVLAAVAAGGKMKVGAEGNMHLAGLAP